MPDQLVSVPGGVAAVLAKVPLVASVVSDQVFLQMSLLGELFEALWTLLLLIGVNSFYDGGTLLPGGHVESSQGQTMAAADFSWKEAGFAVG